MSKLLRVGAHTLGLLAPIAGYAQSVPTPANYTGTELLRLTTNAGSAGQVTMNHVRNTMGYLLVATGGSITSNPTWYQSNVVATGAITTWAVNLPNPAPGGMMLRVTNSTAAAFTTNTTVATKAGSQTQTLAVAYASQTLAANGGNAIWQFACTNANCTTGTWYRIQ